MSPLFYLGMVLLGIWAYFTQAQLAKLAGIRQETLSRLESGKHKPNVRTVERIDVALRRKRAKKK